MEILTLNELRTSYGFSFPDSAMVQYQAMLETATEACLDYVGVEEGDVTEVFKTSSESIHLTHHPVLEVLSVLISGQDVPYRYDRRSSTVFVSPYLTKATVDVTVIYSTGWRKVPAVVKSAVALTVQHLAKLQNSKQMGVLSRSTEGGTEQLEQNIPTLAVKGLLDRYRAPGL